MGFLKFLAFGFLAFFLFCVFSGVLGLIMFGAPAIAAIGGILFWVVVFLSGFLSYKALY